MDFTAIKMSEIICKNTFVMCLYNIYVGFIGFRKTNGKVALVDEFVMQIIHSNWCRRIQKIYSCLYVCLSSCGENGKLATVPVIKTSL